MSGWIGVDLDGTLAYYGGSVDEIGEPIKPMLDRIKFWLSKGIEVKIFTARVSAPVPFREEQETMISEWCEKHIGVVLPITNEKDFGMIEYWDDRAIRVVMNTGQPCCGQFEENNY